MPSSEGLLLSTGKEYASLIKHMHSISVAEIFFVETPTRRQSNYSRKIKTAHIIPLYEHTFPVFTKCLMQQTYDLTKLFARIAGQLRAKGVFMFKVYCKYNSVFCYWYLSCVFYAYICSKTQ